MPGESKTSVRRLQANERRRQALELRAAGYTFKDIADHLGYAGPSEAYRSVMAGLKMTLQEPADEVRKLEIGRCNRLLNAIWEKGIKGDYGAIDRILKILERRARYLGLDAPEKRAVVVATTEIKLTPEEMKEQEEEMRALLLSSDE